MPHVHVSARTFRGLAMRASRERVSTNVLVEQLLGEQVSDADLPAREAPPAGDLDVDDCGFPSPRLPGSESSTQVP